MAAQVYRCTQCRREVLVRLDLPLTETEIARRREEELRPSSPGPRGALPGAERMRDDIWLGISADRAHIPREAVPERCPACGQRGFERTRIIE